MSIYNNHNLIIVKNIIFVNIKKDSRDPAVRCGALRSFMQNNPMMGLKD